MGRIRIYWISWAVMALCFLLVRITFFPVVGSGEGVFLSFLYVVGVWLPVMVLNLYEGLELRSYIRRHHPEKWADLSSVGKFRTGNFNGFRSIPWLFSADTPNDPVLAEMKNGYRRFLYWVLAVFLTAPIFFLVLLT